MSNKYLLAIESSCDETAIAIIKSSVAGLEILSNEISSQVKLHAKWGGVVPNLAAREHVKNITPLLEISLEKAGLTVNDIEAIAVTQGPGLIPALMVGVNFAKTLAYLWEKPLIGIHHIEGHIYANFISEKTSTQIQFPALALVVSGGHTQLVLMKDHFKYEIIGQTLDDAVGEAFDKVARILNIGYPGGPIVSALADKFKNSNNSCHIKSEDLKKKNSRDEIRNTKFKVILPRPMIKKPGFNFSFSGLKTAVLYETKKNPKLLKDKDYISEVCHEFQQAAIDVLISKTIKAASKYQPKTILLAGGVSANKELRKQLGEAVLKLIPDTKYKVPDTILTGDNAAMIGAAAVLRWKNLNEKQKEKALSGWKDLQPDANLKLK